MLKIKGEKTNQEPVFEMSLAHFGSYIELRSSVNGAEFIIGRFLLVDGKLCGQLFRGLPKSQFLVDARTYIDFCKD